MLFIFVILKNKIDVKNLYELYQEGKSFEIKPEEIEHLLNKCEEFFEFYEECKLIQNHSLTTLIDNGAISNATHPNQSKQMDENYQCNYQKLIALRKKMSLYNIKCEVFDLIDRQINLIQKWIDDYQQFKAKLSSVNKDFSIDFKEFDCLEQRQVMIGMLENFLEHSETFYEDLKNLMDKVPHFAKFSKEYLEFQAIKENAERIMREASIENQITDSNKILNIKIRSPFKMSLIEIQNFITEIYIHPIKKEYFY